MIARGALIKVRSFLNLLFMTFTFFLNFPFKSFNSVYVNVAIAIIYCPVQPWLFTEIKEQRNWDITSGERLNILKDFVHFGLEHWGSDTKGTSHIQI